MQPVGTLRVALTKHRLHLLAKILTELAADVVPHQHFFHVGAELLLQLALQVDLPEAEIGAGQRGRVVRVV